MLCPMRLLHNSLIAVCRMLKYACSKRWALTAPTQEQFQGWQNAKIGCASVGSLMRSSVESIVEMKRSLNQLQLEPKPSLYTAFICYNNHSK